MSIFERKVWRECKNGEGECGRVRLARFTLEDHAYGASRLPKTSKNRAGVPGEEMDHVTLQGNEIHRLCTPHDDDGIFFMQFRAEIQR